MGLCFGYIHGFPAELFRPPPYTQQRYSNDRIFSIFLMHNCLRRKSLCTPCDLECMTEFSRRQTTGCVELFLLACYILITPVYERIIITLYVLYKDVCNAEC